MNPTDAVLKYLSRLSQRGFWGFITVKFENGTPVHLRREENLKPANLAGNQLPETNGRKHNEYEHSN